MPELHENQIAFTAQRTHKANLVQPQQESFVADAFLELGALANKTANTIAVYDDNKLKAQLSASMTKHKDIINNARSLDANYDELGAAAMAEWESIVENAPETARNRFLMNNPYAKEEYQIAVQAQVLDKRNKQVYNRTKLDIAQWSSQVVNAPAEYQDAVLKEKQRAIRNLGLPMEQTDDLLFSLQSEVDSYQIASYIANNKFEEAKNALQNGLPTVGAAQRASYWKQLQSAYDAEQERLVSEQKAKEAAAAAGKEKEVGAILREHARLLQAGDTNSALQLQEDWYYGRPIPVLTSEGPVIVDSSSVDPLIRQQQYETMASNAKSTPEDVRKDVRYDQDYYRLQGSLVNSDGVIDWTSSTTQKNAANPVAVSMANRLMSDKERFAKLPRNQQSVVEKVVTAGEQVWSDVNVNSAAVYSIGGQPNGNPIMDYYNVVGNYVENPDFIKYTVTKGLPGKENQSVSGIAPKSLYFITKSAKETYKGTPYELKDGTLGAALFNVVAQPSLDGNYIAQVGLGVSPYEVDRLQKAWFAKAESLKNDGLYDKEYSYDELDVAVKDVVRAATGRDVPNTAITLDNGVQTSAYAAVLAVAMDAATGDYERQPNPYFKTGSQKPMTGSLSDIKEPKTARSIRAAREAEVAKARREGKLMSRGFEGYDVAENPAEQRELLLQKVHEEAGVTPEMVEVTTRNTKEVTAGYTEEELQPPFIGTQRVPVKKKIVVRGTDAFVGYRIPGEAPDFTKGNYEF